MAEAVSSGSWPILFKVLTLNVAICIVLLHFSNYCFNLSSVADFSNTDQGSNLSQTPHFFTRVKSHAVWTSALSMSHGDLLMAMFLFSFIEATLIDKQQ